MKGITCFESVFNINNITVFGYIKKDDDDTFIEVKYNDKVIKKVYNEDLYNENKILSDIENFIEEIFKSGSH
jgi:hypothetical protein